MAEAVYADGQGRRYRVACRCPYSELTVGAPFALDGDPAARWARLPWTGSCRAWRRHCGTAPS